MINREELERRAEEVKLPYREDAIREDDGRITIDWKKIAEMQKTAREGAYSATLLYGTLDHLIDLEMLSLKLEGNYQLNMGGIFLNPRSHGLLAVYFTRREDAEAYKEAMFGEALYPVDIFKLSS